jgi:hypothetical protein
MILKSNFRTILTAAALAVPMAGLPVAQAHAGVFVGIQIGIAPPVLPVYAQPVCPGDGYLWTPGYWAYGDAGYYWVPGVWVQPPTTGAGKADTTASTAATGARTSASTEASTTASATVASVLKAATGTAATSSTTPPLATTVESTSPTSTTAPSS